MRDPYTSGHQQRVAKLAVAIARELSLAEDDIEGLHLAGIIHDVGKVTIPPEILSKPGRLSGVELALIREHAQAGYDIIKGVDFPWPIAQMILQHHERLDGSGYPDGLRGDEILLGARIIAVADVVDAMATHRPYRAAVGIDAALQEIEANRGRLYDPDVVDACLRLHRDGRTIGFLRGGLHGCPESQRLVSSGITLSAACRKHAWPCQASVPVCQERQSAQRLICRWCS